MSDAVVSSLEPVTLIGGADFSDVDLNISLKFAPVIVAADGGANGLVARGPVPQAVIGDLDSLSEDARAAFRAVLHQIEEQDTTDFEKAIMRIKAPAIVALGFTGARLDHTLSVFNVMARYASSPIVLVNDQDAAFVMPAKGTLSLPVGTRVSLMPLARAVVTTQGLRWDATGQAFDPVGHTSPSNITAAPNFSFQATGPVLAVLPRGHLDAALSVVRAR